MLAIKTWMPILSTFESQLALCGDALGVLADAMKFRAKELVLNKLMAELALSIAPYGFEISTAHVWSKQNDMCGKLSRLALDARILDTLSHAVRSNDERPVWAVLS